MEALDPKQKEAVQKSSTQRVFNKLLLLGEEEETLSEMTRPQLIELWALYLSGAKQPLVVKGATAVDPETTVEATRIRVEFEREKLNYEREREMREIELRKQELMQRKEAEDKVAEEREKDRQLEMARLNSEKERLEAERQAKIDDWNQQVEHEREMERSRQEYQDKIRKDQIDREEARHVDSMRLAAKKAEAEEKSRQDKDKVVNRTKLYGSALKASLNTMPDDPIELLSYFRDGEALMDRLEVPKDLRAVLLRPFLSKRGKALVAHMDPVDSDDYVRMKATLLRELKLSPKGYWDKFLVSTMRSDDTYILWVDRLMAILTAYLESRKVTTFEDLKSLMVADRVKQSIEGTALGRQIHSIESQKPEGEWLKARDLALSLDMYVAGRPTSSRREEQSREDGKQEKKKGTYPRWNRDKYQKSLEKSEQKQESSSGENARERSKGECWKCGQKGCKSYFHDKDGKIKPEFKDRLRTASRVRIENEQGKQMMGVEQVQICGKDEQKEIRELMKIDSQKSQEEIKLSNKDFEVVPAEPLEFVQIRVKIDRAGESRKVDALRDSAAEISLANGRFLREIGLKVEAQGKVRIRGVVGKPVEAKLGWLYMTLSDETASVPVLCAISDRFHDNLVVPATVMGRMVDAMHQAQVSQNQVDDTVESSTGNALLTESDVDRSVSRVQTRSMPENVLRQDLDEDDDLTAKTDIDDITDDDESRQIHIQQTNARRANATQLTSEQQTDETLASWRNLAEAGKGGFCYEGGILYRNDKIVGYPVKQLCLPVSRRREAFRLAHSTSHLGAKKVYHRLRLSFFWPNIQKDVQDWTSRCDICQKRRKVSFLDRTPIVAVPRAEMPFEHFFMDCFGPLFPDPSGPKSRWNYGLIVIDSCTRFPFCEALPSMAAKHVCDALLSIFAFTGVPIQISSDNGSNFTAKLTQEFMARLGCSPRFALPMHPRAVGLSERAVGTMKSMIAKLAHEHPKSWPNQLKFALWAMREMTNSTLGVSPWRACFAREMRGPCSILAETWAGTELPPLNLGKSVVDYLMDLKAELERGLEFAADHAQQAQQKYVDRYNRSLRDKSFLPGADVLILSPDTTASKTFSKWQGPAKVIEVLSPHGYLVELDGVQMKVHADRLRRFLPEIDETTTTDVGLGKQLHVDACAVIYDKDQDFGDIQVVEPPQIDETLPSKRIKPEQIAHLSEQQKHELLALLDKYATCFRDTPGLTTVTVHDIHVSKDFKPKRLPQYRIPERLKPEVERQIDEMLKLKIIRPSQSPMASPVVCVLKGPEGRDGVRLAIDMRYVNKYTIADEYPVPDIGSLLQEVGQSSYVTTVDAKCGYHQILLNPKHAWLTGFVCNDALYEFVRTPFGAKNAGRTFCRALAEILRSVRRFVKSYVDDMAVCSVQWDRHMQEFEQFLKVIKNSGLTLALKKCKFAQKHVKWCGQIVGSGIRQADPEKVQAIQALARPKTKSDLRKVLGAFSYFREFIPYFAKRALPLTELTGKKVPNLLPWGEAEQQAFDDLKYALITATEQPLAIIDWTKSFNLHVDASNACIGGFLSQTDSHKGERPLAFFSSKLNLTQQNWSIIEKEAFASLFGLRKFRSWVFGAPEIVLYSDHNPLAFLTLAACRSAKLTRWSLALQEYPVTWRFKRGVHNAVADCFSRFATDSD